VDQAPAESRTGKNGFGQFCRNKSASSLGGETPIKMNLDSRLRMSGMTRLLGRIGKKDKYFILLEVREGIQLFQILGEENFL